MQYDLSLYQSLNYSVLPRQKTKGEVGFIGSWTKHIYIPYRIQRRLFRVWQMPGIFWANCFIAIDEEFSKWLLTKRS